MSAQSTRLSSSLLHPFPHARLNRPWQQPRAKSELTKFLIWFDLPRRGVKSNSSADNWEICSCNSCACNLSPIPSPLLSCLFLPLFYWICLCFSLQFLLVSLNQTEPHNCCKNWNCKFYTYQGGVFCCLLLNPIAWPYVCVWQCACVNALCCPDYDLHEIIVWESPGNYVRFLWPLIRV